MKKLLFLLFLGLALGLSAQAQKEESKIELNPTEHIAKLDKKIKSAPRNYNLYLERAKVYGLIGQLKLQANDLTYAINCVIGQQNKDNKLLVELFWNRFQVFEALEDSTKAREDLVTLVSLQRTEEDFFAAPDLMDELVERELYDQMLTLCEYHLKRAETVQYPRLNMDYLKVFHVYALAFSNQVEPAWEAFLSTIGQGINGHPVFLASNRLEQSGTADQAIERLAIFDLNDTTNYVPHVYRSGFYDNKGDYANALLYLEKSLKAGLIENEANWAARGKYHMELGQLDKAMVCFNRSLEGDRTAYCLSQVAILHQKMGQHDEALEVFIEAINNHDCNQEMKSFLSYRIGEVYFAQKEYELAKEYFLEAYPHATGNTGSFCLVRLGYIANAEGDTEQAKNYFTQLLEEASKPSANGVLKPQALFYLGRTEEARACVDQMIEKQGAYDQSAYYNGACIYAMSGDLEHAAKLFHKAIDLGFVMRSEFEQDYELQALSNSPYAADIIKRLQALQIQ